MLVSKRTFEIKVRSRWTVSEISLMSAVIWTAQKMKFSIRISLVNVTKFSIYCGFGHIY